MTETFPPEINGVAMTIGRMLDGLLRGGHDIQLIRPRQHDQDRPQTTGRLREVLVRGVPLPRYYGLRMGLPATRMLARLWERERPHIVHIVTEGPLGASGLSAARRLGIPVSSDFHTNFHSYSKHYGFGLLEPLIAGYLKRFHNRAACTFVPTRELQTQLAREGFRKLLVVARGVDTGLFSPARRSSDMRKGWGACDGDVVVIHVGRLAPEKPAAGAGCLRRNPAPPAIVAAGPGGGWPAAGRASAALCSGTIFVGMRRGADLAAHYASGDLFLFRA